MLRVLIAEDELILAYAMRGQLEQRGIEVVGLAGNGRAAIEQCLLTRPDVVLMDVRMPQTDGIQATRELMEHCPTCVIMVTAFGDEETMVRAEAAGAMGFLSKPVQAGGVLGAVPKARARFAEFETILAASRDVDEALKTRTVIEAAKRALIESGIAPDAAFQAIEDSARRAGVCLRTAAENVAKSDC